MNMVFTPQLVSEYKSNMKGVVVYEDESCMEGSRFLTLRRKYWRNVNGKPNQVCPGIC